MAMTRPQRVDPARRRLLGAASALALGQAFGATLAHAQAPFPTRPITLWLPWPAGGATDLTFRILADNVARRLGQKVLVENRGGAGGTLAMPILQQAAPDGYTLAQLPQTALRAPWTRKVLWDPIRDTTPIIQISGVTFGIVVPANSPFKGLDDLFAFAKAHPGELTIATNGTGTTPHVVMDDLFGRRGLSFNHVPYKGTSEQMIAVSTGQVQVGVNSNGFAPFVDSGRLRLLVTFGEHRTRRWPGVPTLKELGHGIVATSPYGIVGPAGMPAPVVAVLHEAFRAAMNDPAHVAELAVYDQELNYLGPQEYGRALRLAYETERKVVERLGLARSE
ncbi:tripartite tricarboxylate transporter substrate binding protein [Aquabacterium sp. OR-4]|uniref:tripartite tricarboxylate transporter substrate binding protein n=1 Tax=Aquabacterium sp. OR-4 TaxID=2978127 RepID=UPI0028C76AFE|nr:tripartite tricarboxylate transporter substrate binding protein [Aquabacterium sp. OR-4]MDT7837175.1 tripartite tricarboxylate transporter substrate binding protein [Aquabacterium sp. OR-4]